MSFTLRIDDDNILQELERYGEAQKEQVTLAALRVGVQSLRFARGELDVQALQHVGEQVLRDVTDCMSEALEAHAQKLLGEFSLDQDGSALFRLSQTLDDHHQKLHESLDVLRLRGKNRKILRGDAGFEAEAGRVLSAYTQQAGDHFEDTGTVGGQTLGEKGNPARTGDFVITLGAECAAAGEKIVVEAKRSSSYNRAKVLAEAKEARRNRNAQVCLFVWDREYGSDKRQPPLSRVGNDIVVLWDMADPETDLYLETAFWLARSLVTAPAQDDCVLKAQEKAISDTLDQISAFNQTLEVIQKSGEKIIREGQQVANSAVHVKSLLMAHVEALRLTLAQMQVDLPYSYPTSYSPNYLKEEIAEYTVNNGSFG